MPSPLAGERSPYAHSPHEVDSLDIGDVPTALERQEQNQLALQRLRSAQRIYDATCAAANVDRSGRVGPAYPTCPDRVRASLPPYPGDDPPPPPPSACPSSVSDISALSASTSSSSGADTCSVQAPVSPRRLPPPALGIKRQDPLENLVRKYSKLYSHNNSTEFNIWYHMVRDELGLTDKRLIGVIEGSITAVDLGMDEETFQGLQTRLASSLRGVFAQNVKDQIQRVVPFQALNEATRMFTYMSSIGTASARVRLDARDAYEEMRYDESEPLEEFATRFVAAYCEMVRLDVKERRSEGEQVNQFAQAFPQTGPYPTLAMLITTIDPYKENLEEAIKYASKTSDKFALRTSRIETGAAFAATAVAPPRQRDHHARGRSDDRRGHRPDDRRRERPEDRRGQRSDETRRDHDRAPRTVRLCDNPQCPRPNGHLAENCYAPGGGKFDPDRWKKMIDDAKTLVAATQVAGIATEEDTYSRDPSEDRVIRLCMALEVDFAGGFNASRQELRARSTLSNDPNVTFRFLDSGSTVGLDNDIDSMTNLKYKYGRVKIGDGVEIPYYATGDISYTVRAQYDGHATSSLVVLTERAHWCPAIAPEHKLSSVREIVAAGSRVVFNTAGSHIYVTDAKLTVPIESAGGGYILRTSPLDRYDNSALGRSFIERAHLEGHLTTPAATPSLMAIEKEESAVLCFEEECAKECARYAVDEAKLRFEEERAELCFEEERAKPRLEEERAKPRLEEERAAFRYLDRGSPLGLDIECAAQRFEEERAESRRVAPRDLAEQAVVRLDEERAALRFDEDCAELRLRGGARQTRREAPRARREFILGYGPWSAEAD